MLFVLGFWFRLYDWLPLVRYLVISFSLNGAENNSPLNPQLPAVIILLRHRTQVVCAFGHLPPEFNMRYALNFLSLSAVDRQLVFWLAFEIKMFIVCNLED